MMDVVAKARRSNGWWAVEVPEIPGLFTQARRLDQVSQMVQDAGAMLGHTKLAVTVDVVLSCQDAQAVEDARTQREHLREAEAAAASASRLAVKQLRGQGLTVRDVAVVLGVSPQRVSQLAA